ncbi:MAG: flagellar motor switch protein FliG [Candidatus Eiseniibacteriota bacterium]
MSENEITLENLTGRQKAAILLVSLGPRAAAEVLRQMSPREVEEVTLEMAELGNIPHPLVEGVLGQFYENTLGKVKVQQGGIDYARQVLQQCFGSDEGEKVLGRVVDKIQSRSFRVLKHLDAGQLISFLQDEHPQTIALVLVHLTPRQASVVMSGLPPDLQGEVALRMARLGTIAPGAISTIEEQLEKHVSAMSLATAASGGPQAVVDVLHLVDRTTEDGILESIAEHDPELADEIRNMMFVFEDVARLDDRDIREMLKEVEVKELALALKGASEEIKAKIFGNMSKRAKEGVVEDMEYMGPVRLTDVEAAQATVLNVFRRLEEEGTVTLSGGEEQLVG